MTDLLGKSDRHIAREPMHVYCGEPPEWMPVFLPGHLKWDYAYVLGQVRPDVLLDRWGYDEAALPADVRRRAHEYRNLEVGDGEAWFHVGSPRIRWERLGVKTLPPATAPTSF
jgi:hypothetical protein